MSTPEIGREFHQPGVVTNYHDLGDGDPVLLIHGSGPGVSAWANWRTVLPELSQHYRTIAPDMIGFGYTSADRVEFDLDAWCGQAIGLLDHLGIERTAIIGNSFGGSIAAHVAVRHPERVTKLVLMGPATRSFPLTDGLDAVWGYSGDRAEMAHLVRDVFVADGSSITDDLIDLRHAAAARPTVQERFSALFPAPRQRWVDALGLTDDEASRLTTPTLIVHGRQDKVLPLSASEDLVRTAPNARLEAIDNCGHWVQIEQTDRFIDLVTAFLG